MNRAERSTLRPPWGRGLSTRILALSVAFLLLGEVLIYLPSIARFRLTYLEERLVRAYIATLSLDRSGTVPVAMEIEDAILSHVGLLRIRITRPDGELLLGQPAPVARSFDLAEANWAGLIWDSLETLASRGTRLIAVRAPAPTEVGAEVEIILPEAAMWMEMVDYSRRILLLSLALAIILASLLFWSLRRMIVRPLCEVTEHLARFSMAPEDATRDLTPSGRQDELGIVERQVARMQRDLRRAFLQKTRLAALGAAVARINHDLKNILASAMLISDRLEHSGDPRVQGPASRLLVTLERAARLCTTTLDFARSAPEPPRLRRFPLEELIAEVTASARDDIVIETSLEPGLTVLADRDQLYRVLLNLLRNAEQVLGEHGRIRIEAERKAGSVTVTVSDNGPGIPEKVRERLFQPFAAGNTAGGTGLGLAICKEILRAHGGDIALLRSDSGGTSFRLWLPDDRRQETGERP